MSPQQYKKNKLFNIYHILSLRFIVFIRKQINNSWIFFYVKKINPIHNTTEANDLVLCYKLFNDKLSFCVVNKFIDMKFELLQLYYNHN